MRAGTQALSCCRGKAPFLRKPCILLGYLWSPIAGDPSNATLFSSYPPPERLSRDMPAVGYCDRCNDNP